MLFTLFTCWPVKYVLCTIKKKKKKKHYFIKTYLTSKTENLMVLMNVLHVTPDSKPLEKKQHGLEV